ncbi:MAG TPA: cation diffusion facilitator family transporter [Gemmatimonadaceae bacterium]|nr:cation diffusion facilitator family transporter [Gemmatimonadaceae bacterium]
MERGTLARAEATALSPESGAEQREKTRVALSSVAAAVLLTGLKLLVGLLTGSLGLLAEAAHSGLDLLSSLLTLFSVRIAARPADEEHPYGHGRVENLSATIQGVILLATAAAILYASVRRILFVNVPVASTPWAFVVMAGSIAVDFWRSRMLGAAARRFHSRALEADALNFRADTFSSTVVILGLALIAYAEHTGRGGFLLKADAVAALIVGLVIIVMSGRLAVNAIQVMLDRAPAGLREKMTSAAARVPGVLSAQPVRVRESGHRIFADVVVTTPRTVSLAQAHEITERIEAAIRHVEPRSEAVVHIEPAATSAETAADAVRAVALRMGASTHHERVYEVEDGLEAALHLEVEPDLTLAQAHAEAHRLADALLADNPRLRRVDTHIEVAEPNPARRREVSGEQPERVDAVRAIIAHVGGAAGCRDVRLYQSDGPGWDVSLTCLFAPHLTVGEVHRRTELLETRLRERLPDVGRVLIHAEPAEGE